MLWRKKDGERNEMRLCFIRYLASLSPRDLIINNRAASFFSRPSLRPFPSIVGFEGATGKGRRGSCRLGKSIVVLKPGRRTRIIELLKVLGAKKI